MLIVRFADAPRKHFHVWFGTADELREYVSETRERLGVFAYQIITAHGGRWVCPECRIPIPASLG